MSAKEQAQQAKDRGNAAFKKGDFDEAVQAFSQAISLDPSDPVFWSNRSMVYASKEDFPKALEDANQAIKLKPDWSKAYSRAGLALYKMNKYEEAKKMYENGLQHAPTDQNLKEGVQQCEEALNPPMGGPGGGNPFAQLFGPDMISKLASNPQTAGYLADPSFAAKIKLLQTNPNMIQSMLGDPRMSKVLTVLLGLPDMGEGASPMETDGTGGAPQPESKFESKKPEPKKAEPQPEPEPELTEEEKQKRENKKKALAEKEKGNEVFAKREFEKALQHYSAAIALDPTDATFYSNRCAVHAQKKEWDKVIEEAKAGIQVAEENHAKFELRGKLWSRLGDAYKEQGKFTESISAYEKSLVEHTDNKVKKTLKDLKEDIKKREEQNYINPELSEKHKEQGNAYAKENKWADAIREYTEALRRDPKNYKVLSNRALAYTKLMDWSKGLEDCDSILKIDPKFVKAFLRKGKIQHFLKQFHKAVSTYEEGLKIEPTNEELKDALLETRRAVAENMNDGDNSRAQEAMKDPEIQAIMRDPVINQILQDMQTGSPSAQAALRNPDVAAKINKLITAGILKVK